MQYLKIYLLDLNHNRLLARSSRASNRQVSHSVWTKIKIHTVVIIIKISHGEFLNSKFDKINNMLNDAIIRFKFII